MCKMKANEENKIFTVQKLLDILNNREEIPNPEVAELCFYLTDEDGNEFDLELTRVGAFDISTDITVGFKKTKNQLGYLSNCML